MVFTRIVIAGCGNPLFADDGFGPAVADALQDFTFPDTVMALDAGTSAPDFLFPLLDPAITKKLIVADSTDFGAMPGSIIRFDPGIFPPGGLRDSQDGGIIESLLRIRDRIDVTVIGCQPRRVTGPRLEVGLSDEVMQAVPRAVRIILALLEDDGRTCP
jgi:coenzyme F420 hydrogenase subunit delta